MQMFGLAGPSRNRVNIQVNRRLDDLQALNAGLLGCFGQRDLSKVGHTIGMSARLQPPVELDVMHDQRSVSARVDHRSRAGEVTCEAGSVKSVRMGFTEPENLIPIGGLRLIEKLSLLNLLSR